MEVVNYRITEGSEFMWQCFGIYAYQLDSWNGDNDTGHSVSIVFDTQDQTVYQMETYDYKNQRAYRWTHPEYVEKHSIEAKNRGVDINEALEDIKFTDLDVEEDMLEKTRAIVAGEDYDTDVMINIDIPDDELLALMKRAHQLDITFNQLVSNALNEFVRDRMDTDLEQETHLPSWNIEDQED